MSSNFRIGINTAEEILSNPPEEFRHLNVVFAPFSVSIDKQNFPASFWTDFAGVFLFKWYWAVWKLAEDKSSYARLPFWYTYEMWLRRTTKQWWRLSLVERHSNSKKMVYETLIIPEVVESALLTAIQKLIAGARRVGIWPEDCAALEVLLNDRGDFLKGLEVGTIRPPAFLTNKFVVPIPSYPQPSGLKSKPIQEESRLSQSGMNLPRQLQQLFPTLPFLCPRCTAVLQPWSQDMQQQTCPLCGESIPR